jgi:hypothetical protein
MNIKVRIGYQDYVVRDATAADFTTLLRLEAVTQNSAGIYELSEKPEIEAALLPDEKFAPLLLKDSSALLRKLDDLAKELSKEQSAKWKLQGEVSEMKKKASAETLDA